MLRTRKITLVQGLEIGSRTEGIIGDVEGTIVVDGSVAGIVEHNGRARSDGQITLGELAVGGYYTQFAVATPTPTEPWSGDLRILGNLNGEVIFRSKLDGADVSVGGSHTGSIMSAQVYDSTISLNTTNCSAYTDGLVIVGRNGGIWETNAQGVVDIGRIDVYGEFYPDARIDFYGCYQGTPISSVRTVCIHLNEGGLVRSLICKKPPITFCPPEQYIDPCSQ